MEKERKESYETPSALAFAMTLTEVVCASPTEVQEVPTYKGFNPEEEW